MPFTPDRLAFRRRVQEIYRAIRRLDPSEQEAEIVAQSHGDTKLVARVRRRLADDRQRYANQGVESNFERGYEVKEEYASGAMGVVHLGRQLSLDRTVAIKMILDPVTASSLDIERFRNEARIAADLHHPGVVAVYEIGTYRSRPCYSMELVQGKSLEKHLLAVGELSLRNAVEVVRSVASAMAYVHEQGVVHLDIKPSNIILTPEGDAKISDFGLARKLTELSAASTPEGICGTPEFMAPEQVSALPESVGPKSDIYALGSLLYCLLTGNPPFRSDTERETLRRLQDELPVLPRIRRPEIDKDLESICLKCLRKNPADRYADMITLAEDLERNLKREPVSARSISSSVRFWRWCMRNRMIAGSATAFLSTMIIATAVSSYLANERNEAKGRAETLAASNGRLLVLERQALQRESKSLREEQTAVARAKKSAEEATQSKQRVEQELIVSNSLRLATESQRIRLEYPERGLLLAATAAEFNTNASQPALPEVKQALTDALATIGGTRFGDGNSQSVIVIAKSNWLAVETSKREVLLYRLSPEPPDRPTAILTCDVVSSDPGPAELVASRDGKWLAVVGWDHICRLLDLSKPDPVNGQLRMTGRAAVNDAAFSPDGRWLAICDGTDVRAWDLHSANPLKSEVSVSAHWSGDDMSWVEAMAFSQDNKRVYVAGLDLTIQSWDVSASFPSLTRQVLHGHAEPVRRLAVQPSGKWMVSGGEDGAVRLWDLNSATPNESSTLIGNLDQAIDHLSIDDNGRWVIAESPGFFGAARKAVVWDLHAKDIASSQQAIDTQAGTRSAVCFAKNGTLLITGGEDHTLRMSPLSNASRNTTLREFYGHEASIRAVANDDRHDRLFSIASDGSMRHWSTATGAMLPIILEKDQSDSDYDIGTQGELFAACHMYLGPYSAAVWSLSPTNAGKIVRSFTTGKDESTMIRLLRDDTRVLVGCESGTAYIWDLSTEDPPIALQGHTGPLTNAIFLPRCDCFVTTSVDGTVRSWRLDPTGAKQIDMKQDPSHGEIWSCTVSRDESWMITDSRSSSRVWKVSSTGLLTENRVLASSLNRGFDALSRWAYVQPFFGNKVCLFPLKPDGVSDDDCVELSHVEEIQSGCCVASSDGRLLATGAGSVLKNQGHEIKVWHLDSESPVRDPIIFASLPHYPEHLTFIPGGTLLAVWLGDVVHVYDLSEPTANPRVLQHENDVVFLSVSDDGEYLAGSQREEKGGRLWILRDPSTYSTPLDLPGSGYASFSKGGRWLIRRAHSDAFGLWPMQPSALIALAKHAAGRELTQKEREIYRIGNH